MGNGLRYRASYERIVELVRTLPDEMAVPATPDWNLLGLLAHLCGAAVDLTSGNEEDWSLPGWTAAQVMRRVGRSRDQLLTEWSAVVDGVVARVNDPDAFGLDEAFGRMPVIDAVGHEHDIAEAAAVLVRIESGDWSVVKEHRRANLEFALTEAGAPPLRVRTDEGDDWALGAEEPATVVQLPRHELWRSLTGRRTRAEVRGYGWSADPAPYVAEWVGGTFSWPSHDLG
jgi:hypothetical protein